MDSHDFLNGEASMTRVTAAILCLHLVMVLVSGAAVLRGATAAGDDPDAGEVEALLLLCTSYGANYNLMRDVMEHNGWNVTTTALTSTVSTCYWGGSAHVDVLLTDITDLAQYDILAIMPARAYTGTSHAQLLASPDALSFVTQAVNEGLLVAAFCGGTRVLAAADVINGVTVTGHPNYEQEYLDAGAIVVGMDPAVPPVVDGNIITSRRGQYYAVQVCDVMQELLDERQAAAGHD